MIRKRTQVYRDDMDHAIWNVLRKGTFWQYLDDPLDFVVGFWGDYPNRMTFRRFKDMIFIELNNGGDE